MSKLDHALDAAARGFAVFPQQGKRPAIRRWPDNASSKPSVITRWWTRWPEHDIGIALPPDIYVLDADTDAALDAASALNLPSTLTVETARGCHWYFRVPHELRRMTGAGGNLFSLEGKGAPGPVTWAGSVHPSGHVYAILCDAPIAHMPGELVRAIGPKRTTRDHGDATDAERETWAAAHAANIDLGCRFDFGPARDARDDAYADLRLTKRVLRCELPDMPAGWADRAFRAGAYLGPHVATGALGLDQTTKELTDLFAEMDTEGRDNSHVLRSIERGLATGARGSVSL